MFLKTPTNGWSARSCLALKFPVQAEKVVKVIQARLENMVQVKIVFSRNCGKMLARVPLKTYVFALGRYLATMYCLRGL